MNDGTLTEEELRFVAEYGNGKLTRALAIVKLAKRNGKLEELRGKIAEEEDMGMTVGDIDL